MSGRYEHAAHAWRTMRSLLFDLHDRRAEVSEALQLSFIRAKALIRLQDGPLTMRELAGKLATDAPYTSVVVDDLERRGLVLRSTHPDDRRVKLVSLTESGAGLAAAGEAIQNQPPAAFDRLSGDELATLDRILTELAAGQAPTEPRPSSD